ncbi:hypothetical protein [Methylotenera sp.]|uniref:hypothetical protein n=1 Tax=Methylotenera sp. TaxID=2051956 RepID=UPI002489A362|nr:hypothetical protein [Methylotenera sp.]MDI1300129.1 hypothetical protein [Methylotenera sp.]
MLKKTYTKAIILCLALSLSAIATAGNKKTAEKADDPTPLGLVFGKTTIEEALIILKKEGGTITNSGNRRICGDTLNPYVEGYFLNGVNIQGVTATKVWFLNGVLMELTYELSGNFEQFNDQLKTKYGDPSKSLEIGGMSRYSWLFKNMELAFEITFSSITMDYSNLQLLQESQSIDGKVCAEAHNKAMRQIQKGF